MKRFIILFGALAVSAATMALERKFAQGYEYAALSVNTGEAEGGLSVYKNGVIFARKDSAYLLSMPDTLGQLASKYKADDNLTALRYEGQFAYDANADVLYVSHEGLLYAVSAKNGKFSQLDIEGLGAHRKQFGGGSSIAYRRWRYMQPGIKGMYNPALSSKGDKLYFSAEFEGGKGGRDIWMVTKKTDGTWSAPKNMSAINTERNEDYPFLAGDSLLYFSSDRADTLGGWNIYRSNLKGQPNVAMLPEGVNSKGNDYNFVGNKQTLFVISDRGGNPDIYSPYKLLVVVEQEEKADTVPATPTDNGYEHKDPAKENHWEFEPCTFYFQFDKDVFVENYDEQIKNYARFMKDNPDKTFVINGYTDIRGNMEYNFALSDRRCQAVYQRLLMEGIDANQLQWVGYGKGELAVPTANDEASHLLNRRVEIKVAR